MERNDIEYIFITELDTKSSFHTTSHVGGYRSWVCADGTIMIIWKNSDDIFFEFNIKISDEFRQDLEGVHKDNPDILKDLIIDYPKNNKEVSLEYLQERYKQSYQWSEELNKKLLPYIRNEKLNKLIN